MATSRTAHSCISESVSDEAILPGLIETAQGHGHRICNSPTAPMVIKVPWNLVLSHSYHPWVMCRDACVCLRKMSNGRGRGLGGRRGGGREQRPRSACWDVGQVSAPMSIVCADCCLTQLFSLPSGHKLLATSHDMVQSVASWCWSVGQPQESIFIWKKA